MKTPKQERKIRVLLVDDHPVVLGGIRAGLSQERRIELVGTASSGRQLLRKIGDLKPDVVLMDISLPDTSGIVLTKKLSCLHPAVKVLAFTMHENKEYVLEMLKSGAKGYALKTVSPKELAHGIIRVHGGETFFSEKVSRVLLDHVVKQETAGKSERLLTRREEEILALVAGGLSSRAIAKTLALSARTVDTHRERIMKKLGVHNAVGLAQYAMAKGIVKT